MPSTLSSSAGHVALGPRSPHGRPGRRPSRSAAALAGTRAVCRVGKSTVAGVPRRTHGVQELLDVGPSEGDISPAVGRRSTSARLRPQASQNTPGPGGRRRRGRRGSPGSMCRKVMKPRPTRPEYIRAWGSDASAWSSAARSARANSGTAFLRSRSCATAASSSRASTPRWTSRWARCRHVRALRDGLLNFGLGPVMDFYTRHRTAGRECSMTSTRPVIFVANHSSHLDTPTILRAIPRKWRSRTAVGAAADYFYKSRWKASGVALLFNTVPIARTGGGLGNGARDHVDRLIQERWNLADLPRGHALARRADRQGPLGRGRDRRAERRRHRPDLRHGTYTAMPPGRNWPKRLPGRLLLPPPPRRGLLRRADPARSTPTTGARSWPRCAAFWDDQELRGRRRRPPDASTTSLMHRVLRRVRAARARPLRRASLTTVGDRVEPL